jgi:octaprenyl-diphosphate synthase
VLVRALVAGADEAVESRLGEYAWNLGMAFQLVDDVLDFTAHENVLGKPVGSDLKEGKLTLPLIYLMREGEPRHRDMVRGVLRDDCAGSRLREAVLAAVREYRTADRVLEKAHEYAHQAKEYLAGFPSSPARDALLCIPDYIVERDR